VIDVVEHLETVFKLDIELIAFVPARLWKTQKKIIKSHCPKARVYPMLGSLLKWRRSRAFLKYIKRKKAAICRGPLAYGVAEGLFEKVIYDGRAAVKAEVEEYNVTGNLTLGKVFIDLEYQAVSNADFRIAVSNKLVEYWNADLGISVSDSESITIPCTLSSYNDGNITATVTEFVKVVYSGGTGVWQSFEKVVDLFRDALNKQPNLIVLFLTKNNDSIDKLEKEFPNRVSRKWLKHSEVTPTLSSCDYGILIRESSITNKVASPVKFAEYLNAGLKVLISPNIGDFSGFVRGNNCGITILESIPNLQKTTTAEKSEMLKLCSEYFNKNSKMIELKYKRLIEHL
jgi:hypothetical protein